MPDNAIEQYRKFKEQEAALFVRAKADLMAKYDDLAKQFEALGIDMPNRSKATSAVAIGLKRQRDPQRPCPYCNVTGHDGRLHRNQGDRKRAFTSDELESYARQGRHVA